MSTFRLDKYEVTAGTMTLNGEDLLEKAADERARLGLFYAFQRPVAIPGVTVTKYLRTVMNAQPTASLGQADLVRAMVGTELGAIYTRLQAPETHNAAEIATATPPLMYRMRASCADRRHDASPGDRRQCRGRRSRRVMGTRNGRHGRSARRSLTAETKDGIN